VGASATLFTRLRADWNAFAERARLRALPAVPAVVTVILLGMLLPFAGGGTVLPAQLESSLAAERLQRFYRAHEGRLPEAGPSGPIYSTRPAFFWPECPGADYYTFRLYRSDGSEQASVDRVRTLYYVLQPPGGLEAGANYRFEVSAVVESVPIQWQEQFLVVRPPPEELDALLDSMHLELGNADGLFVLLGYYADLQSPDDVVSTLIQWKAATGELDSLDDGTPETWIETEVRRLERQ